jgi:HSP20 family protein
MLRFNPMWEFGNLTKDLNKMMHYVSNPINVSVHNNKEFLPRIDILEDEKNIYFQMEIPGVKKEDVKVSVNEGRLLTIKGDKQFEKKDEVSVCCRNERIYGQFTRSFQLPELVDSDKIEARYDKGILYLTIPKLEPAAPKEQSIDIN